MMRKYFLLLVFFCSYITAKSQVVFQVVYGDTLHNDVKAIIQTTDRNYAFLGSGVIAGDTLSHIILTKTDSMWTTLSTFVFETSMNDYGFDFKQTPDHGYIICGSTFGSAIDFSYKDILVIKCDQNGNIQWSYVYGNPGTDEPYSITLTHDHGYFITGFTNSGTSGYNEGFVLKIDSSGTPLWYNANNVFHNSRFSKGCNTIDSGFVATGSVYDSTTDSQDLFVVKYNRTGNVVWSKRFAATGDQEGNSVTGTTDGGCIVAGTNSFNNSFTAMDMMVVKLDNNGNIQWAETYGDSLPSLEDRATDIKQTVNGNYVITGYSNTSNMAPVMLTDFLEINSAGIIFKARSFGDQTTDNLSYSIHATADHGFIFGGTTNAHSQAYIVKTDSTGTTRQCSNYPSTLKESAFSLTDSAGCSSLTVLPNYFPANLIQPSVSCQFGIICISLSGIGINEQQSTVSAIQLFPNPVSNILMVDLSNPGTPFETLIISDVYGRTIVQKKISAHESFIQVDVTTFCSGIYMAELRGQKKFSVQKFIKVD